MSQSQPDSPELEQPEVTGDPAVDFLNQRDADKANAQQEGAEAEEEEEREETEGEEEQSGEAAAQAAADELAWLQNKRKISVQGQELEISAEEAFKGYMRDADYRQKTEQAAQLTRQAEQVQQAIQQERQYYVTQLDVTLNAMHMELVGDEGRLPELLETDPVAYLRVRDQIEHKRGVIAQALQHRQLLEQQSVQEQERSHQTYVAQEQEKLQKALPEWRDPKVKEAETNAMGKYLLERGYSPEELNMLTDHRAALIVRDAAKWRLQQELKSKQQTQAPPRTATSGARQTPNNPVPAKVEELKKRALRSGKEDDMVAFLNNRS